jgi:hypothetical protein
MSRTITKTVYQFEELSDSAKERAREWWRGCENQDFDTDFVFEDAVTCGKILGIDIATHPVKLMNGSTRRDPTIFYSGFSSQGDGACFEGTYAYAKGSAKAIRKHVGTRDHVLWTIADSLQAIQRRYFYRVEARMKHSGHYSHSGCMSVDVSLADTSGYDEPDCADDIKQCMREFADWIYRQLESEYDYRMANEQVDEAITCNEYEFDETGKRC